MLKQEVVGCLCGKEETLRWKALCVFCFFVFFGARAAILKRKLTIVLFLLLLDLEIPDKQP